VTASEHEGFCIPLVEAMDLRETDRRPRVRGHPRDSWRTARCCSRPSKGRGFFAEAVTELLSNAPLRDALVEGGQRRLAELEDRPPDTALVEALLEVV